MFKRFTVALAALSLLVSAPASADYVVKDGAAATQTFGSFSLSGVQFPKHAVVDPATGLVLFTAASPGYVSIAGTPAMTVSGVATSALQTTINTTLGSILAAIQAPTPAGTNAIGTVGVSSLPALPTGSNTIGTVNVSGVATAANQSSQIAVLGATTDAANANSIIGQLKQSNINLLAATPAGTNIIGKVGIDPAANTVASVATPTSATGSVTAYTAGTTSAQALAAAAQRFLAIDNESTTSTVACAFGVTAAVNAAGSFTLPPGSTRVWDSTFVPSEALNCIASTASTPVTIQAN